MIEPKYKVGDKVWRIFYDKGNVSVVEQEIKDVWRSNNVLYGVKPFVVKSKNIYYVEEYKLFDTAEDAIKQITENIKIVRL